jgi:hypothetical protein
VLLQASLSEQIRDVRKMINQSGSTATPSRTTDMSGEQRLAKLELSHQHILQMLDQLQRRVNQLETSKQSTSGVRYTSQYRIRYQTKEAPLFRVSSSKAVLRLSSLNRFK